MGQGVPSAGVEVGVPAWWTFSAGVEVGVPACMADLFSWCVHSARWTFTQADMDIRPIAFEQIYRRQTT